MDFLTKQKNYFSKFQDRDFINYQKSILEQALESDKKVIVINAPTGSGKSLIAAVLSKIYCNAMYLTHTKGLQNQLINDFPEFESLKGRSNYPCLVNPELTRLDCIYDKPAKCSRFLECPYGVQKTQVINADLRIMNYAYMMVESNYVGTFTNLNIIVADEGDLLPQTLSDFMGLKLRESVLHKFGLGYVLDEIDDMDESVDMWLCALEPIYEGINKYYKRLRGKVSDMEKDFKGDKDFEPTQFKVLSQRTKELERTKQLLTKISILKKHMDDTWIIDRQFNKKKNEFTWEFSPLWLDKELSDRYFFSHAKKFVLMSATFPNQRVLSQQLGVSPDEMVYIDVPSVFPKENMPIYVKPVADMGFRYVNQERHKMKAEVENLLDKYPDEKGLIHCVSYKLRDYMMTIDNDRLITHDSHNRDEVLETFMKSDKPLVLVSPSMDRGVSLDDDLVRFMICIKAPYLNLKDKKTERRMKTPGIGNMWYKSMTATTLEQMVGRGVRSVNDYCDIYLLDTCIHKLIKNNADLFSRHFKDCLIYED